MLASFGTNRTTQRRIPRKAQRQAISLRNAVACFLLVLASPVFSGTVVSLTGSATHTQISGFAGTPFTLGKPEGVHAVYGIWSVERNDKPCYIGSLTEDVNNSTDDSGTIKNLCGANPTSNEMKVQFGEIKFAERTFVRALRVCMNNDNTRVKGL
ncbi:MAG: hypothetical protein H0X43_01830 [Nitrosospira sp.]|nr:hypothetical protein [Nitrosospira sp.]